MEGMIDLYKEYKKQLRPYLNELAMVIVFIVFFVIYIFTLGFDILGFFMLIFYFLLVGFHMAGLGIMKCVATLIDSLSNNFVETELTFVRQNANVKDANMTLLSKHLKDSKHLLREVRQLFFIVFKHKDGKYYYMYSSVYFDMKEGELYLLTVGNRSRVLVDVKCADGKSVPSSLKHVMIKKSGWSGT